MIRGGKASERFSKKKVARSLTGVTKDKEKGLERKGPVVEVRSSLGRGKGVPRDSSEVTGGRRIDQVNGRGRKPSAAKV